MAKRKTNPTHPCPLCQRPAPAVGVVADSAGVELPVFQCEHCEQLVDFGGEKIEVLKTFCVNSDGVAFDPAEPTYAPDAPAARTSGETPVETN